jgi:uncharacterized protein (DUF433 family)
LGIKKFLKGIFKAKFSHIQVMVATTNFTRYFEINPEIRFGRPVIKGTRITVYDVLGWLASGQSQEAILEDFPQLNNDQILACLTYANH